MLWSERNANAKVKNEIIFYFLTFFSSDNWDAAEVFVYFLGAGIFRGLYQIAVSQTAQRNI